MRTAGLLLMDTPLPDGRIWIPPFAGISIDANGIASANNAAATTTVFGLASELLSRFGMSDDAQAAFGQGSPSGGFQGAQAQGVSATTPFTTPYGISGRPPFAAGSNLIPPTGRPKGIMPLAVSAVYSVSLAVPTSLTLDVFHNTFTAGAAPTTTKLVTAGAASTAISATTVARFPVIPAAQKFLTGFDTISFQFAEVLGATASCKVYGFWLDVAFNYN